MWKARAVAVSVVAVEVGDPVAVGGDHHGLVLAEFDGLAGVLDERGDVGAEEHLAVADADDQRRGAAGRDDGARVVGVGEHQREVALEARAAPPAPSRRSRPRCRRGGTARATRCTATSVSVSLANSTPAASSSARRVGEVLDDAVVDDGDLARGVAVRVRVAVGRAGRGWPSGCGPCRCCREHAARRSRRAPPPGWPAGPRGDGPSVRPHRRAARCPTSRSRGTPSGAARRPRRPGQGAARRSRRFRTWYQPGVVQAPDPSGRRGELPVIGVAKTKKLVRRLVQARPAPGSTR